MIRRPRFRWRWLVLLLLMTPVSAEAQRGQTDIGVGYQWIRPDDWTLPVGGVLDVSDTISRHLAVVGEVGWSRGVAKQFGLRDVTSVLHIGGGVRWITADGRRVKPFGQVLLGFGRFATDVERFGSDSDLGLMLQPGGGMMVRFGRGPDIFGQMDFRLLFHEGGSTNAARFAVGARFHLRPATVAP